MDEDMREALEEGRDHWGEFQSDLDFEFDAQKCFDLSKKEPVLKMRKLEGDYWSKFQSDLDFRFDAPKYSEFQRKTLKEKHWGEFETESDSDFEYHVPKYFDLNKEDPVLEMIRKTLEFGNHLHEFQIDLDFEFNAPKYIDLSREEPVPEASLAEKWFETAKSDPPSPITRKIQAELSILSEDDGDNIPDEDAERNL